METIKAEKENLKEWLSMLSEASRGKRYQKLWKRVYAILAVPSRRRVTVNLYKLNKHSKAGDNIIVPGKVLSNGAMDHHVNIAAMEFSGMALKSLKGADCKILNLKEMLSAEKIHVIV